MGLYQLVSRYIDLMNLHNGPDSTEAKQFVEEHSESVRFVRVANIASSLWSTRHHSVQRKSQPMEVSPDKLDQLVGWYAYLLNLWNGPDSPEARKFFEDHKDIQEFKELAETAALVWQKHNRQTK